MSKRPLRALPIVCEDDTPTARLGRLGARALTDSELLDVLVDGSPSRLSVLVERGGISCLGIETEPGALVALFGQSNGLRLAAYAEVRRRHTERAEAAKVEERLDTPQKVFARLSPLAAGLAVEKCWVVPLNRRNRALCSEAAVEVSSGTATSSLLHPREVFRVALRFGASAIIVCHNHPSGDPSPSHADRAVTKQLNEAGRVMGVELLDHVIIGRPEADPSKKGWFSLGEAGCL